MPFGKDSTIIILLIFFLSWMVNFLIFILFFKISFSLPKYLSLGVTLSITS